MKITSALTSGAAVAALALAAIVGAPAANAATTPQPPAGLPSAINCTVTGPGGISSRGHAEYLSFTSWEFDVGNVTTTAYRNTDNVGVATTSGVQGASNRVSPALFIRSESYTPETISIYSGISANVNRLRLRNPSAYQNANALAGAQTRTVPTSVCSRD